MPRRICIILNPVSGGGRGLSRWEAWRRRLEAVGIRGEVRHSLEPGAAVALAESAAESFDVVVAAGGDGTVMEVATGLVRQARRRPESPCAMAILPTGSGNDGAKLVGARDADSAVALVAHGAPRGLDLIQVECRRGNHPVERMALCVAASGMGAELIALAPPGLKRVLGGRAAYVVGFFRALFRHRSRTMRVTRDGTECHGRMVAVVAANHTHAGGGTMHVGPGANPTDGRLDISVIHSISRLRLAGQFVRLVRGTHVRDPAVDYQPAREVRLASEVPVAIQADGEILGHTPAVFRVLPRGLRVLADAAVLRE